MRTSVLIGIGTVGLLGGLAAAGLFITTTTGPVVRGSLEDITPMAPVEPDASRTFEAGDRTGERDPGAGLPDRALRAPTAVDPARLPEGEHARPDLGPAFENPVERLEDLDPRYEVAMAATLDLSDLPPSATSAEVERAMSERLLHTSATVARAAQDHLAFAETAPREQAQVARGRAAELYEHLAGTLSEAPVPGHLPQAEADLHRQMLQRMADQQRRRAQALRAER